MSCPIISTRQLLGAAVIAVSLVVGAGPTRAQLSQNLFRANDGTAYQVLRFESVGSAERTRITTVAGSLEGTGACSSPGVGTNDPVSAAGGVLTGVMTLYPFDQVHRTAVVVPTDGSVTFDAASGGRVTLGSNINVCASSLDCVGTPNPQALFSLDSSGGGVPAACIANGFQAACESSPRDAFAFGLPGAGTPPVCLTPPTVNGTVCGAEPGDGVSLQTGGAIVFIYSGGPELCFNGVSVAAGAFGVTADPDSGLMCGANSIVSVTAVNASAPPPPPDVCATATPTAFSTATQTLTSGPPSTATPTATITPTGLGPVSTPTRTISPTPGISATPTITETPVVAAPASGAGVLHYPLIRVANDVNTFIQLSNVSDEPVDVLCFYENVNGHCGEAGPVCQSDVACGGTVPCIAGYGVMSFRFHLDSNQPIAWTARSGLLELPPPATGSIPAVPELPFTGVLRCIQVAPSNIPPTGAPTSLTGNATIETFRNGMLDAAGYAAIGSEGFASDGNGHLQLGGFPGEYAPCGNTLILPHLFTPATDIATQDDDVDTELVLVPCAADYGRERPVPQQPVFLDFDEFDTRLSAIGPVVRGQLFQPLSEISLIFDSRLRGSLAGQTRINGLNGDFMALAVETHSRGMTAQSAIRAAFQQGESEAGARIDLYPACAGDCNADDQVGLDELVRCMQVANGEHTRADCPACDADRSGAVDPGELMLALKSSTGVCARK